MSVRGKLPLLLLFTFLFATTLAFSTYDPFTNRDTEQQQQEEEGSQSQGYPLVFQDQHFSTIIQTEHGRVRLLQKFTQRSKLFKGIENFRILTLEADPHTFIVPNHLDAEAIFFVGNGRGTISLIRKDSRESFNVRRGDLVRVQSGTTIYLINRDNNEKLVIVKLLQPVSTRGEFRSFYGAGGQEPESFYRAFSIDLLVSALNTKKDKLQRVLNQRNEGVILKASEEQIRSLSQREEGGIWPFGGGDSKSVYNLLDRSPSHSNKYGKMFDVDRDQWKALQELDDVASINYVNNSQGTMNGPFYNSKTAKIAVVIRGEGYLEIACPHEASSSQSGSKQGGGSGGGQTKSSPSYRKVSSQLRPGTVYIVPAGHPIITVASQNQNLEVLSFAVGAKNTAIIPLAGKNNIFSHMEKEAKELAFNVKASNVDEVFQNQDEEFFYKAPQQWQQEAEEGRAYA